MRHGGQQLVPRGAPPHLPTLPRPVPRNGADVAGRVRVPCHRQSHAEDRGLEGAALEREVTSRPRAELWGASHGAGNPRRPGTGGEQHRLCAGGPGPVTVLKCKLQTEPRAFSLQGRPAGQGPGHTATTQDPAELGGRGVGAEADAGQDRAFRCSRKRGTGRGRGGERSVGNGSWEGVRGQHPAKRACHGGGAPEASYPLAAQGSRPGGGVWG